MKILHVLHTSAPFIAGYCVRSSQIIENSLRKGMEQVVVTSAQQPDYTQPLDDIGGVKHYRTPPPSRLYPTPVREYQLMSALYRRVLEVIEIEKPDLIHAHSPVLVGSPAARAARKFDLPVVYEIRDFWENALVDRGRFSSDSAFYRAARSFESRLVARCDHVVTISEQLRLDLAGRKHSNASMSVVPNGFESELDQVQPSQSDDETLMVGYIGTFQPYEGLQTLLHALTLTRDAPRKIQCKIVGGGGIESELRQLVSQLGLQDVVEMPGRVPRDEVPGHYASIDLFVYPRFDTATTRITTPLKPFEAMGFGKPVAVSNLPAMLEIVEPDKTGYVFESGDAQGLANLLLEVAQNRDAAREIGRSGQGWVLNERNWSVLVDRYASIYSDVLERNG